MPTATVTSKGQVTIPLEIRKSLRLNAGDKIDFCDSGNGQVTIRPKKGSIMAMKGMLRKLGYVPTIELMDRAVQDAVSQDYIRSVSASADVHEDSTLP